MAGNETVYEGVRNDDWRAEDDGLVLVIGAEIDASESLDLSCQQASDCEIENVGSCCGYYPRCVNADSLIPPFMCPPEVVGVCGWPDITHCECVENTCRSMQGDQEV